MKRKAGNSRKTSTAKRKLPRELAEGLKPIKVGLLRQDYDEAIQGAVVERYAVLAGKLEVLRHWYGIESGPDCWRQLCLAMAAERFSGFRMKAGRKPPKWTTGVLWMLAGEMRRAINDGATTQEQAAKNLAGREPWTTFLGLGRWNGRAKPAERDAWQNLLATYSRMPQRHRAVGEDAYQTNRIKGTLPEWDRLVRDMLERPTAPEK